ncbi:MAG TPA: VanW family protein [Acidimicrobiia bacterium]|nr:VanW family protein [Acidimicrobiia bacterium]
MVTPEPAVGTRARRVTLLGAGAALVLISALLLATLGEHLAYRNHVLPNVHAGDLDLGGDKLTAAIDALDREGTDLARTSIRVRAASKQFSFEPSLIGWVLDSDATARRAQRAGRKNPVNAMFGTVLRRFRADDVPLVVHYDPARFEGLLDGWAYAVNKGVVEGGLRFEGTTVVTIAPHTGTGIDRAVAARLLDNELHDTDRRSPLELPVGRLAPHIDQAAVDHAAAQARELLTGSHVVQTSGARAVLSPQQLVRTLGTRIDGSALDVTIDPAKLAAALRPALGRYQHPPVDASFAITTANTVRVVPSRDGRMIDTAAVANALLDGQRTVDAPLQQAHPMHDTAWARSLGITRFVSSFTTQHPAGQPRVHNIHTAADVLNNTVVEPGETFSLNGKLGPRTHQKGYVKAPVIVEDGFGEDYGGGVSQLATTLFNAMFFGGYEDISHTTHTYYISRYPMGREATVNYPSVDLKFRDDTSHGILIRTSYTDTTITVTLYGNNDGRTVREDNRHEYNFVPISDQLIKCPVDKPELDPNNDCARLNLFEKQTVATGEPGWDVTFERVIDEPGKPERREHYRAHYPMLPNKVLVGTVLRPTTTTKAPPARTTSTTSKHP